MVHGVPERPAAAAPGGRWRRCCFDFHGTLAQVEEPVAWVLRPPRPVRRHASTGPGPRCWPTGCVTAGRAGGPRPHRVPPHLAEVWADRDLYPHAHRAAFTGLAATVEAGIDGLRRRAVRPAACAAEGWRRTRTPLPTLRALRAAGVPVAVVSNIGFDIRALADALGIDDAGRRVRAVVRCLSGQSSTQPSAPPRTPARASASRSSASCLPRTP